MVRSPNQFKYFWEVLPVAYTAEVRSKVAK